MINLILVFNEDDKNKLVEQGLKYVCRQGDKYLLRNDGNLTFSKDVKYIRTNKMTF